MCVQESDITGEDFQPIICPKSTNLCPKSAQIHHQHDQKHTKNISLFIVSLLCSQRRCADHLQQVPTGNNSMVFYKKLREELVEISEVTCGNTTAQYFRRILEGSYRISNVMVTKPGVPGAFTAPTGGCQGSGGQMSRRCVTLRILPQTA